MYIDKYQKVTFFITNKTTHNIDAGSSTYKHTKQFVLRWKWEDSADGECITL